MDTTDNPQFKPFTNDFTEEESLKRRARAIAASKNLFQTDISKLDDAQVSGLYQATARALFQIEDPDGKIAFGKKSGDARTNVGLLRDFCKGNYKLIQDDEYETWRAMDEEQRFRYALENEAAENKAKSNLGGQRGAGLMETLATGSMYSGVGLPAGAMATARKLAGPKVEEDANAQWNELARRSNYESLTPEEQAVYRKDVIEDYEKKLSKRQVLATYLAMTDGLSDRASTLLAKAYNTGTVDIEAMETLPQKERDQAYTALSIMRGDQKKGHILGIPTDFTDDTAANRLQLCLYGFQQGILGLIPDTYELAKDITKAAYARFCLDDAERKRYIDRWDAQVRAEQALKQGLPEAESWLGTGLQGAAESFALMLPYFGIGKGGKLVRAATAVNKDASWLKRTATLLNPLRAGSQHRARAKLVEGVKAVEEADYAETFARLSQWKTVGGGDLTVGNQLLARQLANIENYTKELRELKKLSGADLRKWGLGAASWSAGEATAFGSFAKEYVETCDAAGISRYDSVPMAAVVGLVNAQIEHLYVPGLESTLSASEVKSLMFGSMLQAMKTDGAKGFWTWLGNRIEKGVVEGVKVTATEGMVEEPLQQIVIEHGKAISAASQKLREEGRGDLADWLSACWDATKDTFATDFQTFVDTAVDSLPSSVVFGLTTIGNQTRRQRIDNMMARHENRAKYAREVERAKANGEEIPAPPVMLSKAADGSLRFDPNGVDYDVGIADMIGKAAATQKAVTDYWAGNGQKRDGEDVRLANALSAARKAWESGGGDVMARLAGAAQVDMRTAEVIAQYFISEDEARLYSPQLMAFADYNMSTADMSEKTLERILPGYVKGSYKADEKNGVYSGQVKLEDGSVKTIAYKVGDISEELMKVAEEEAKIGSSLGVSHDARIRSGTEQGGRAWDQMSDLERYAYALRSVNAIAGGAGVIEVTETDGTVSRISADDVIYLSNGHFGDVGYGAMANLGTARHETWHAIWRFTKSSFTEAERQNLAKKLGIDVAAKNWEVELDEAMAYQFELYASGAHVPHVATGAIDRLMQSTAAKWIGELSKFGLADEVKNAKTGKAFALADFYDAVMRGEIGTGRLGIAQVATETPQQKAAETRKKTSKELPVEVSEDELAEAERAAAEAAAESAEETEAQEHPKQARSLEFTPEGVSREDANAALAKLKGKDYTNKATGITARLSSNGAGKLVSNAATAKSQKNGFTKEQHNSLAANIDSLFENAVLLEERPGKNGDVNIRSIKRFACPVKFGESEAAAYITVKESVEHGHRIYSVEGMKIAELSPMVRRALTGRNSADNPATGNIIANRQDKVKSDYTLDSPADASVPDARFYRISAGDGVDLVGELVVSDARDLKTSYKGNLSDPSLQNRAETVEGRSLVEKIAGSPDPLQVGTVQPRANNGFVWTTPSLDTFIGNTRESGISAAYEKGNAAAVKAYMLAEAAKRGIEVPEGIGQPLVHFVLRRIESKDGKASIQDVVRMTNQSVNRGMNVYEQAKNDADVLAGAGLVPHIALRPDGRIDTAKSAEAIGRFIQETGAQGMVDENTDTLTEDGQARLQNAVLAALFGGGNADTVAKMMRESDRLDIENEKRALMKAAAELMRIAEVKPQYDLRQPLAEALDYYLNWRDVDERGREDAGKNRRDWYERTKDGLRKRGLTWAMHMGQGDMFRTPSPEARLLGDLLAASRDLRSFDGEDRETDAGKKRAQDLVTTFLGDYIRNADAVNTETMDLLGTPPPSRIELLETHRGTAEGGTVRFSTVKSKSAGQIQPSEDDSNPEYISHGGRVPQVVDDDVTSGLGKLANIISKNGQLEPTRFFNELARTFGFEDDNPDKSKYVRNSDFVVRLANHRANAAMFLSAGETQGNTSVVIKMSEYPFHAHQDVELKEFVYFPDKLDAAKEIGIANALKEWIATGTYSDANADQVNVSPRGRRYSTVTLPGGEKVAVIDRDEEIAKINLEDPKSVHDYLLGKVGQQIFDNFVIGSEAPTEYIFSKDARGNNKRIRKAKAKLATGLDNAAEVAGNAEAEIAEHKERQGGVYYRRPFLFAVKSGFDGKYRAYSADMVSYMEGDVEQFYDVVNIEDAPSISADLTQLSARIAANGTSRIPADGGATASSIAKSAANDNGVLFSTIAAAISDESRHRRMDAPTLTDSPAFKAWFAESKIVDADGKPLVVYHGTNNDKTTETWNERTKTYDIRHEKFWTFKGGQHYFNSSEDNAGGYGSEIYAVYLRMVKPLVIDCNGSDYDTIPYGGKRYGSYEIGELAKRKGFDGVILKNIRDGVDIGALQTQTTDYIVFDSRQVKSATDNRGTFDPKNPDVRFSTVATPWRPDFPDAVAHTTRAYINGHYAEIFNRAKAGDVEAAEDLVEKVCKVDKIRQLGKDHPNARIVAPVVAQETSGHNQIPRIFAKYIASILGIETDTGIVQTVRANHTGSDAEHRLFVNPEFDGEVVRGAEYIIVDDHITQGGTINALRDYIERNGGKVVAVSALTLSQGSSILSPHKDTLDELYAKWPDIDNLLRIGGIAESAGALTQSQARYILKFSTDTFRNRAVAQGNEGSGRTRSEALGASPSAEVSNASPSVPRRSFSTVGSAYPALNRLSDEQLIAVALASKTVFGKAGKKQSQHFTINEVQRHIKALHPDWDGSKVSLESMRIYRLVRPIKAKLQEDIQRGVSQSNILQHLPERLKEEFGSEMTQQARTGARIGTAHQRAVSLLEERKVKVVEDAVRVQSGVASQILENQYGVDLSQTLMNLADNPLLKKDGQGNYLPPAESGSAPDGQPSGSAENPSTEQEVEEKVKKAVTEIVGKTQQELEVGEANRRSLSDQRGRDAERAAELAGEGGGDGGLDLDEGDIVEIATRKAGVDLQNPRHLALFVTELARRHWVKEHGLAIDADAFKDAVALQFLRKTAQDVYGKLVREITYSRSRDSATAAINGFEHVPTLRGLISEMTFAGQLINARMIREKAQEMCEKLDKFLREKFETSGRFKPDKEELKRKVSAEMQLRARYARHAIWLTPNAAGKEAYLLQKEIDAAAADFEKEDHDAEQSRVMTENIRKINILREFGGLRYKPLAQIQSALEYWENAQQGEADYIVRENYAREIRTKKAAEVLAKAFRNPNTKYAKDGKALLSAIDNYITGHMGFTHLLRDMMRYASKEDAAAAETILQYLELEIQKAGTQVMTRKRRHADALAKAVQRIYGRNFSKVLAEFCKEDGRFAEFMGETDGKKDTPTKGRAMQLMVSLLQVGRQVEVIDETDPERKKTKLEWQGGYHDNIVKHHREGQAAKIAALLSPQDLQLIKWLGDWYDNNRQELSDVCQDLFGIGVYAETSNYMPVKMRLDAQGLEKGDAVGWTNFPKALMPRVRNERDFDTRADILQMFMARMEEGEQWKAHAKLGLEMRGIFGRSELQASVIASHGTKANAVMLGFVTDILAGHGARERAANGVDTTNYTDLLRGWAALGALGGNVGVMLKQTTSIPAFGFEVGLVKTGRYMLSAFTPDGMAAMKKIWDSDERRNRWNVGNSEAVANAIAGNDVGALKRLMRASMITNKVGDCVPGLVCGQGIYRDCIEQGMDEEDAMAKTWMLIERTQQSGRIENQAGFQRRTKFGRVLYQFLTTQQQYLSYEARAIRSVAAKPGDLGRWGKLGETLILNHFLLSSAYFWMGQLYKRLLGQEPDEDGEIADWMVSCLLGPYGALYGLGITTTEAINTWIKGRQFGTQGQLPSLSWASNLFVHDPARLIKACFDEEKTFDDVVDAAAKWASDSNAIFRDLWKVYRWRIKEEPQ